MKNYIVTGASGFLGSAVTQAIQLGGDRVIAACRQRPPVHANVDWLYFDLRDPGTFASLIEARADGIVHLAWSSTPAVADRDVTADVSTNLIGTISLLEEISQHSEAPFVFASSGGTVYGKPDYLPIAETHQLRPISFYGQSKATVENYGNLFRRRDHFDFRVARIGNPYGATQSQAKLQGTVPIFARKILSNETLEIWGDGTVIRDYLHVTDTASAIVSLLKMTSTDRNCSPIFNIGSGQGVTLNALIKMIAALANKKPSINFKPNRAFDVEANVLDISKMTSVCGWRPAVSLHEGLDQVLIQLQNESLG